MKVDLYTKCILTVIACALLWLCFGDFNRPVSAQGPVRVVIDGVTPSMQPVPVRLIGGTKYNTLAVDEDNPVAVKVVGQ
jgi:hypothetical protein